MAAEKEQPAYPLAPANAYGRSDEETAAALSKELRRKRNKKRLVYLAAFVVFQTIVILVFALTVMRIKSPKYRVRSALIETLSSTNDSFNIRFYAQVGVKNTNFGHYKYENSTIVFYYRDVMVGEAPIDKARAKARSTKKVNIVVDLSASNLSKQFSVCK
ncbi:hypothetical protein L1049_021026 [Liquidambar formosana]|uniref:Late embryogenesis abundant protein LEA-2 subgroup domain-containing protein n=1 Tax=Liquidambar formosana TaxID=63359 RepID=A0AAP0SDJ2_LIQFO